MAKLRHTREFGAARRELYPLTGDALDAIMKGFRAQMDAGVELPPDTVAWVEACETVKARVKKPPQ